MSSREDIQIFSDGEVLDAWLYPAAGAASEAQSPAIVLAHGLGGTKEMRLDAFADRFSKAGFVCLVFDYRYFGKSTGKPRGLIDVEAQVKDWNVAIEYTAKLPQVDPQRIGIFGSSFSGGHVIRLAATNPLVKATVSQCPFTDGFASSWTVGLANLPKILVLALWDMFASSKDEPVRLRLVGKPGELAFLNSPDSFNGCRSLLPPGADRAEIEAVPARLALQFPFLYPGSYAKQVKTPILFAICGKDQVAPANTTLRYAKQASKGTIEYYPNMGHFDIYTGDEFEKVVPVYTAFYQANLD